ncbi:DUF1642 domain-containing protein [Listeria monocytogenes]|nr:DUF1642 domain-containing protein [Listeria monocytogenes]EHX3890454.1 DUF1642 domain-containing protein [Listeria monocytogenes]EJP6745298.1 DUF1642 domain-containing protein [Listeria monocytogenes]EJP6982320.1 DUF1642 domain-containing protein [Listeria monocytogenes]
MKFKKGENVHVIAGNELLNGWYNGKEFGTGNSLVKVSRDKIISTKDCFIAKEKEAELVVVPKLIGDFLENHSKEDGHTLHDLLCDLLTSRASLDENVYDWIMENNNENGELFARAWLDGYEVEKEPLYYVQLIDHATGYLNVHYDNQKLVGSNDEASEYKTQLTESEIKAMNKGEAYWLLKEPVEEVEGEA